MDNFTDNVARTILEYLFDEYTSPNFFESHGVPLGREVGDPVYGYRRHWAVIIKVMPKDDLAVDPYLTEVVRDRRWDWDKSLDTTPLVHAEEVAKLELSNLIEGRDWSPDSSESPARLIKYGNQCGIIAFSSPDPCLSDAGGRKMSHKFTHLARGVYRRYGAGKPVAAYVRKKWMDNRQAKAYNEVHKNLK